MSKLFAIFRARRNRNSYFPAKHTMDICVLAAVAIICRVWNPVLLAKAAPDISYRVSPGLLRTSAAASTISSAALSATAPSAPSLPSLTAACCLKNQTHCKFPSSAPWNDHLDSQNVVSTHTHSWKFPELHVYASREPTGMFLVNHLRAKAALHALLPGGAVWIHPRQLPLVLLSHLAFCFLQQPLL